MFASFPRTRNQRRGVVLILVLGMLGLLALIGVTFATFSGQVKINSRNFSQAQNWPDSTEMMDYALAQLINDTDNPQSAIRGHSLVRDMYGNDAFYNAALLNGHPASGAALTVTAAALVTSGPALVADPYNTGASINVVGLYKCITNLSQNDPSFYGYNFTRWIMKFPGTVDKSTNPAAAYVGQTHEILAHDALDASGFHVFYIAPWDGSYATPAIGTGTGEIPTSVGEQPTTLEKPSQYSLAPTIPYPLPSLYTNYISSNPTTQAPSPFFTSPEITDNSGALIPASSTLIGLPFGNAMTLDGRFLHAFNGPGISGFDGNLTAARGSTRPYLANRGMAQYANFRLNGTILNGGYASATNPFDPPAVYGYPNEICGMDEDYDACDLENWFLALQSGDSQVMIPSFHRPGTLIYDPNVTDPVTGNAPLDDWTSQSVFSASKILRPRAADGHSPLAFPDLKPNANGQITYDVDNDGDGTTDSVWLDLGYPPRRNTAGQLYKPLFAFMIIGLNGRIPLNTAGNLQLRDLNGTPLAMHASGKGFSPSELDPSYALQNAHGVGYYQRDNAGFTTGGSFNPVTQVYQPGDGEPQNTDGRVGVPIALTQLRNLLAGARSQDSSFSNHDRNFIIVNNQPWYVPNGVGDMADTATSGFVSTATTPIPGRWGEGDKQPGSISQTTTPISMNLFQGPLTYTYSNPVRAGLSGQDLGSLVNQTVDPVPTGYGDARDDNHNTFDFYPANVPGATAPTNANYGGTAPTITTLGENADYYDASGSLGLAVERLRRFVTPLDVAGDGLINNYQTPVGLGVTTATYLLGSDSKARVAYFKHFRPPGAAISTRPGIILPNPLPSTPAGAPPSLVFYPYRANNYMMNMGNPPPVETTSNALADRTSNILHGFEWHRNPDPQGGVNPILLGAMQSNNPMTVTAVPTYDQFINSSTMLSTLGVPITQPSANLNEADEMQLYNPSPNDQPYGPGDLEWLYRQQDTDGVSLASRLKDLAPVSFTNPADGVRRRRMFSIESWEPTTYVWANDTPSNDAEFLPASAGAYVANSSFNAVQSAGLHSLSFNKSGGSPITPIPLPPVAHRGRKINLNFPLPVSNRYDEPVRQKWIRETYQLLKQILPPKAVDTPEELAKLSQFVVNLVDFRDPDCTATRFVNTDLFYSQRPTWDATNKVGLPAVLSFSTGTETLLGDLANVSAVGQPRPPAFSPIYDNVNSPYLVQYGMEHNPVAITEVLAFNYRVLSGGNKVPVNRLYFELLNTLTQPKGNSNACDLELNGWDFVIMPDTPLGRPDPFTGQLPFNPGAEVKGITLNDDPLPTVSSPPASRIRTTDTGPLPGGVRLRAMEPNGTPHPLVFGSDTSGLPAGFEVGTPPASVQSLKLTSNGNTILDDTNAGVENQYYWLYLRRPANPFDTSYDGARPNENRVVVDSFRFLLNASKPTDGDYVTAAGGSVTTPPVDGENFSLRRLQPFRGGHSVPPQPTLPPLPTALDNYGMTAYGFSEQTSAAKRASSDTSGWKGRFGGADATGAIWHTLGKYEAPNDGDSQDIWSFFAFNDRDFTSVAELLQVPACPPGLFTKQFIESPPPIAGTLARFTPPNPQGIGLSAGTALAQPDTYGSPLTERPKSHPYLADEFFYTAQHEPTTLMANATQVVPRNPADIGITVPGAFWPDPGTGPAPIRTATAGGPVTPYPPATGRAYGTFPLRVTPGDATTGTAPYLYYEPTTTPLYIGGPSGAGWYKMFEFFDVPSPSFGSIGSVAQGSNYDWMRQDLKPGQLNANLIIDEEVFFAVMSESWLKTLNFQWDNTGVRLPNFYFSPSQLEMDNMGDTRLNVSQIPAGGLTPKIVTQVTTTGAPTAIGSYAMKNQGFMALDPYGSGNNPTLTATQQVFDNRMKVAFSDFLKLRHGGSGYMFAHQYGPVGSPNPAGAAPSATQSTTIGMVASTTIAAERPFRSFSFPDVNYTLLRPAALPPSSSTPLSPWQMAWRNWDQRLITVASAADPTGLAPWLPALPTGATNTPFKFYVGDPGVKNPYLFTDNSPVQPPPIPARRLFQVPDVYGNHNRRVEFGFAPDELVGAGVPEGLPTAPATFNPSNASNAPSTYPPALWTAATYAPTTQWITFTGDPNINWQNLSRYDFGGTGASVLGNETMDFVANPTRLPTGAVIPVPATDPPYVFVPNFRLGANTGPAAPDPKDNRQHPAFRYDWIQKVTNLTTVRTHQYAVWITVGFFEVTKQGDPRLGNNGAYHALSYDRLGQELNIQSGKNVRYRSFFIIDRTRAVGFSPQAPGNFRDCITYRQTIE